MVNDLCATVFVSWGLWVATCPRPDCLGAEHYGHAPITGVVGGLTLHGFRCGRCGLTCRAQWPQHPETIWELLRMRPLVETRNWKAGEPVENLLAENVEHGLIPAQELTGLAILNGELAGRARQLVPPLRAAIGAF